jgi:hypothetical protein
MRRFVLASTFILLSVSLWGQSTTGTLFGVVTDSSGGLMSGVSVTAIQASTQISRTVTTNESGFYAIANLPADAYQVEFQRTGFKKEVHKGIHLRIGDDKRIESVLEPGQFNEIVTVEAPVSVLQTDAAALSTVIDGDQILGLPINGRQFTSLVQLTEGAVTAAPGSHLNSRGGFNAGGNDEHYTSSLLDGIDNVDPVIRNTSLPPSLEFIREFQFIESGYNAEFGRNAGAVINATTKSGSNAFHGSFWEYLMNDNLNAKNYFALPGDKPPLIRNQFGATIGGPIRKNKTFFFAGYEGLRMKAGLVRRAFVPTARMRSGDLGEFTKPIIDPSTGLPFANNVIPQNSIHAISREVVEAYPLPNATGPSANRIETANNIQNGDDVTLRVDHSLTLHNMLTGRFSSSRIHVLDPFRNETGGGVNLGDFGQTADRLRTNVMIGITTTEGGRFVNELRAGYNRFHQPLIPLNPGTPAQEPLMGFEKAFLPFSIAGFDPLGSGSIFDRTVNVYNYTDSASYFAGNHQFKAGVDVLRYLFNFYLAGPNSFSFTGARTGNAFADFLLGLPTATKSVTGSPGGNPRKTEVAFYAQDDWKVTQTLTLNYGLRWEYYGRIIEQNDKQSIWLASCNCIAVAGKALPRQLVGDDLNNFAPRLGIAYRPWGGRTVVRASGGIYYDNDMRTNSEVMGNPPFAVNQIFNSSPVQPLTMDNPFPSGSGIASVTPSTLDINFRDTYAESWNLSVQREIRSGTLIDVAYVASHTLKARRAININQPVNGVRPYSGFTNIIAIQQAGNSNFNSLQIKAERRFSKGLGFTSVYMWGHAIDDRPSTGTSLTQDNNNMSAERGDSDFDVRHRATFSGMYRIPFKRLGDWNLTGILVLQSGRPFTVFFNQDWSGARSGGDRPNAVDGVSTKPLDQGPNQWINPAAFSVPARGTFGNLGRNTLRGPGYQALDVSLSREFQFRESGQLQIRLDAFNLLNHPNFNLPSSSLDPTAPSSTSGFGVVSSTVGTERQIQIGLRIGF